MAKDKKPQDSKKIEDLKNFHKDMDGTTMTTNQGLKINDTNNSLKSGERGSTLLEDFLINC